MEVMRERDPGREFDEPINCLVYVEYSTCLYLSVDGSFPRVGQGGRASTPQSTLLIDDKGILRDRQKK